MTAIYSQVNGEENSLTSKNDIVRQTDVIEILGKGKIRLRKDVDTLKVSGPYYSFLPALGYSLASGFTGAVGSSTSFYADTSKKRFSSILANAFYSQYNQYWFYIQSSIFFTNKKIFLRGDWRFYKFPTKTYGIGANTKLSDALPIDYDYLRFYEIIYREIKPNIFIGLGYHLDYHWNIKEFSTSGTAYTEIQRYYRGTNKSASSGISINFLFDNRHNSVNPQQGSYASIQVRPNFTFLGSDNNWQALHIDLRHYIRFPASSKNVLAFWSYNNFTLDGKPPYLDMPSIGWDDYSNTGRGYVPGRFTARNLAYFETEYRFRITSNGLFGGVVFGNLESVFRRPSNSLKTIIPGYGLGLRIKLNKFSNTNIAIDYGFGIGGSQGFFVNLGEVF